MESVKNIILLWEPEAIWEVRLSVFQLVEWVRSDEVVLGGLDAGK